MSKTDKAEISELAKLMFTFKDSVSPEEQEYYLKLLGLCKEIKDSFYPVDGNSKTSILDMRFTRKVDHCNEECDIYGSMKRIPIGELDKLPPFHPECRCVAIYYLKNEVKENGEKV